jgi:hypothetical protein
MDISKVRLSKYFYQNGDRVYSLLENDSTLTLYEESVLDKDIMKYNYFEACKGYKTTKESLIEYVHDFENWCDEIRHEINYKKYYNHDSAVKLVFQSKSKRQVDALNLDDITFKEFSFFERCPNSGLMSFDSNFKDVTIDAYGYDFSAFYPNMLLKLNLATKQGKRKKLKQLDFNNIQYGIYKVKITTDDKRFLKLFMFSKDNYYTHYSLRFANKHKDTFNVKMELIIDDKFNALIYDDEKLVQSKDVFGKWFNDLASLKIKYPKNHLVKRLMSSLWGSLTQFNRECFEDIEDIDISELYDEDETEYKLLDEKRYKDDSKEYGFRHLYYAIPSNKPYKHNLARLKPFLVSYCRSYVAELVMKENLLDNVVRIHTDGIVLNKEHDFTHLKYYPKPEDKTTGKIKFSNVIKYSKI